MIARMILAAVLLSAGPALAQNMPPNMPGMPKPAPSDSPATTAYKQAMEKMHAAMDAPLTGNPDQDFVNGMIPHHQGAIDMARVELQYGKDPHMRDLARRIIAAQQQEIDLMRRWQARTGEKHAK